MSKVKNWCFYTSLNFRKTKTNSWWMHPFDFWHNYFAFFFFVCKNVHCNVKMAVLWMLKAVLVHAQYVGQARTVQVQCMLYTGKTKGKMFRAVHVMLELFMSQVLTVQNFSVLLQKYHTKQNLGWFLLSHPSASLPWNWVTLHKVQFTWRSWLIVSRCFGGWPITYPFNFFLQVWFSNLFKLKFSYKH